MDGPRRRRGWDLDRPRTGRGGAAAATGIVRGRAEAIAGILTVSNVTKYSALAINNNGPVYDEFFLFGCQELGANVSMTCYDYDTYDADDLIFDAVHVGDWPASKEVITWYVRCVDIPRTRRGDAAAGTWRFRGDYSRRRRGRDVDIPWR